MLRARFMQSIMRIAANTREVEMKATWLALGLTAMCTVLTGPVAAQGGGASELQPQALQQAANLADKLQDDIAAGRWDVAQQKLSALQRLVPRLDSLEEALEAQGHVEERDAGPEVGVFVDSLANRLEAQRRLPALVSANAVARALLPLIGAFSTPAQLAVARLDVAGRDLQYDAERGSWDEAAAVLKEIREAYATVQPHLVKDAPDLNATVQRRLANLADALEAHLHVRAHALAGEFIQDVDLIHSTYRADR